jgi:Dolichyl-phosphate-mannose-protein mannosyltransferase
MESGATVQSLSSGLRSRIGPPDLLLIAAAAAVLIGFALRAMHADAPLWLDETFTGAIAAEPSLRAVVYQNLQDVNAPAYFLITHYWSLLFGLSDQSLRFPAFVFASTAPLLCLIPAPGVTRRTSFLWCALTALWVPGISYAQEARCYSLLLCLGIATTLSFIRLIDKPSTKHAALWALCAAAATSTHYYALVLVGVQGLAYLWLHGRRALRTWPAFFVFLPVFAWLCIHAERIAEFAGPQVAWYHQLDLADLIVVLSYLAGSPLVAVMLVLIAAIAAFLAFVRQPEAAPEEQIGGPGVYVAVAVAFVGAALLVILGFWRPCFTLRYLMPFIPGILLGLALMFAKLQRHWRPAPVVLVLVFAGAAVLSFEEGPPARKRYNFETASQALMDAGTRKLVFLWDNASNSAENPSQLQILGGFFFRRAGVELPVVPVKLAHDEDPNLRLLAAADAPHTGILWLFDPRLHDTAARDHPPRITEIDPAWHCHDFGTPPITVLACLKDAI